MKKIVLLSLTCLLIVPAAFADEGKLINPTSADDIINQLKPEGAMKFRGLGGGFRGIVVEMPKAKPAVEVKEEITSPLVPVPVKTQVVKVPNPVIIKTESVEGKIVEQVKPVIEAPEIVQEKAEIQQPLPSLNMKVSFEFNSAALTQEAKVVLALLGQALSHEDLKSYSFMIAGHTDAAGGAQYNQKLSEHRARAVGNELVHNYGIERKRLQMVGFGERQLLRVDNPRSSDNRRVQVMNLGLSQ